MTDRTVDEIIGKLLRIGVLVSAGIVLAGGIWLLAGSAGSVPAYQTFHRLPAAYRSPHRVVFSLAHPNPYVLIQFGLLVLIATPVARVVFSIAAFALERDRLYVVITLIVLGVLVYSLAVPHG